MINNIKFIFFILLLIGFEKTALAESRAAHIEVTKSNHSETLGDIYSLGLYSIDTSKQNYNTYLGVQLAYFNDDKLGGNDYAIKLLFGQELSGSIAPFYEFGTDLYGFISLLAEDKETDRCEEEKCAIDFYFRLGLRIKLADKLTLGVFHENIKFGDSHETVSGFHNYTSASFGFQF